MDNTTTLAMACMQVVMHDHLAYRYEVLSIMGRGSFGQVGLELRCKAS